MKNLTRYIAILLSTSCLQADTFPLSVRDLNDDTGNYFTESLIIDTGKTALIVMDPWVPLTDRPAHVTNKPEFAAHMKAYLLPLIQECRRRGIKIIYASHQIPIHPIVAPKHGDYVLNKDYTTGQLKAYLKRTGITTLLYAGYATNMCILNRPAGMMAMAGPYKMILFRDCTLAVETAATAKQQEALKGAITMIELNWAVTSTLKDLGVK